MSNEHNVMITSRHPCRIQFVHPVASYPGCISLSEAETKRIQETVLHYRPHSPSMLLVDYYRMIGCDSDRFFWVEETGTVCCEHELLAD